MKKQLLVVAGLALAASVALTPLALADTAVPTVPTCSQALDGLAAARAMPVGDVATKQILLDQVTAAQIPLAADVVAKQKAFDNNVDPTQVAALQAALNTAKANAAAGQAKIDAAVAALAAEKKLAADRDAAIVKAQVAVDKACKGDPGGVTTTPAVPTTTPPPVAVVVPNAIDTGYAE